MSKEKTPRDVALYVLNRTEEGSWASELLRSHLDRTNFNARDRRFVTEMVYGVLRNRLELDHIIGQFSKYSVTGLDQPVRNTLRLGVYQLLYMRVPQYAACDRSVQLIRRAGFGKVAGLVNGVLRNIVRNKDNLDYPRYEDNPEKWISITESHPRWFVRMLIDQFGVNETIDICRAHNEPPSVDLRVNSLATTADRLKTELSGEEQSAIRCDWAPHGLHYTGQGQPQLLPQYKEGKFSVQGQGSQLCVLAADVTENITVLDACAGKGGKTTYLAELMENSGEITAVDVHEFKLKTLDSECKRLRLDNVRLVSEDIRSFSNDAGQFDLVIVDAPCSGTGLFQRHPEARWQKEAEIIEEMSHVQGQILNAVSPLVAVGGALVYCTCSLSREENEDMVKWFLKKNDNYVPDKLPSIFEKIPRKKNEHSVKLLPHVHGTDGFYIARLRRTE